MSEEVEILLVDDSESDIFLVRTAFRKAKFDTCLQQAGNGAEAIAYLSGEGPYGDRHRFPLPKVMLLDLNMPMKNGFEVLAWVRAQPGLKRLTIIILTASLRMEDVERAYDLGANSFFVKPSSIETLTTMIGYLRGWIHCNHFPPLIAAASR